MTLKVGDYSTFGIFGGPTDKFKVNTLRTYSSGTIHGAIDVGTPTGTKLYAPFGGTVTAMRDGVANNKPGDKIYSGKPSNWILLRCKIKTNYGQKQTATILFNHLSPGLKVKTGQYVKAGQLLGFTGNTGNSTGPHTHVGAQWVRTGRGSGANTRYDHIANTDLRIWPPDRFTLPGEPRPGYEETEVARWYKYSGKPAGDLWLPVDKYTNLDATIPAPPRSTFEHRMVYLNVEPTWKLPKSDPLYWFQTAVLRVRWTRAGKTPDPTGYQTFVLTPWEATLITHTHWEEGEAGRGGVWSMRLRGMVTKARVSTRYSKGTQE